MTIEVLKASLDPWVRVGTWTSSHPLDEARFHKAVSAALRAVGERIPVSDFEEAMMQLARQHHPGILPSFLAEYVEEMAQRAEHISSYVFDTLED